jgi:hypothetical protein
MAAPSQLARQLARPARSAPFALIRLGLEERPKVLWSAMTESDADRLVLWLGSNHELRDLVNAAIDLAEAER